MSPDKNAPLTILLDAYWGKLTPTHQSTANADVLMANTFESLISANPQGGILPSIAHSWEISSDLKTFRFHLREGVRFSDGTPLTAGLYRDALLASVSDSDRSSHNPNALDVLYRLKGFSIEAALKKNVPGLKVESDNVITFEFEAPFRSALFELMGTRYSVWKKDAATNEVIGTGPYIISHHIENERVEYTPNPYAWTQPTHEKVIVLASKEAYLELCRGNANLFIGRPTKTMMEHPDCKSADIGFQGGSISGNTLLSLNGLPGHLFSNPKNRLAFQYLATKLLPHTYGRYIDPRQISIDPQFFPEFSPGRLSVDEANRIIQEGEKYVPTLVAESQKKPIRFLVSASSLKEFQEELEKTGLKFSQPYTVAPVKTVIEATYGRIDYDINGHSSMVGGQDPDGLYHLLGKTGSLHSPAISRPTVEQLFESARSLNKTDELHIAYQEASRAILSEVPSVHLSFVRCGTFYSKKTTSFQNNGMVVERLHFNQFEAIQEKL